MCPKVLTRWIDQMNDHKKHACGPKSSSEVGGQDNYKKKQPHKNPTFALLTGGSLFQKVSESPDVLHWSRQGSDTIPDDASSDGVAPLTGPSGI